LELNQLIDDCIHGKRASQSQLYSLYAPKMFTVCLRYGRNREEAEETLQEGFVKVFENLSQFRFAGSFEGWIRRIMVNCALQKYRRQSHLHAIVPIESTPMESIGQEEVLSQISTKELLQMVQALPAAYRLVFNLYVFEGMKHREIAELLGISEGTSKSNLFDARAILQKAVNSTMEARKKNSSCL
jgi:RNA polymerase sigma factor (sigma-70 family)